MVRVPCKIALHIANLHSNGYFSLCGIIIPPDKTVCFFTVLSRGIISISANHPSPSLVCIFSFLASSLPSSLSEAIIFLPLLGFPWSKSARFLYRPSPSRSMMSSAVVAALRGCFDASSIRVLTLLKTERMESAKFPLAKSMPPMPTTKASINAYSTIPCPFCLPICFHLQFHFLYFIILCSLQSLKFYLYRIKITILIL